MRKQDIPALTGLRFIAAMAIVFDHLWPVIFKFQSLATFNDAVHQLAFVGMTLFFVLSGFIIHYNYSESIDSRRGLWSFFIARFSRLYPLYLALLLVDLVLIRPPADWSLFRMLTMTQSWAYGFSDGHLFAFPYRYTIVAWSISTEVFFYVVYPFIGHALKRMNAARALIGVAAGASIYLWWCNAHPDLINALGGAPAFPLQDWLTYVSPYTRVAEFLTGCAVAQMFKSARAPVAGERRAAWWAGVLALVWIVTFVGRGYIGPTVSIAMRQVGLLLPISIFIFVTARYGVFSWLNSKVAILFGEASYSIYLLHLIAAEFFAFEVPLASTRGNWISAVSRLALALAVILIASRISYRCIEAPARKWLRRQLDPRRSVVFEHNDLAGDAVLTRSR